MSDFKYIPKLKSNKDTKQNESWLKYKGWEDKGDWGRKIALETLQMNGNEIFVKSMAAKYISDYKIKSMNIREREREQICWVGKVSTRKKNEKKSIFAAISANLLARTTKTQFLPRKRELSRHISIS